MRLIVVVSMLFCVVAIANPLEEEFRVKQCSVGVEFIQVRGEPDWAFWTQPYARDVEFEEGAGRVFGPVAVKVEIGRKISLDLSQLGFREVDEYGGAKISSPRVTFMVDRREVFARGILPADFIKEDTGKRITELHNSIALTPRTFTNDDLKGGAAIYDTNNGAYCTMEATSTGTPGVFRLDQLIGINACELKKGSDGYIKGPKTLRGEFVCNYEITDGSQAAFLIPIGDRKYVLVISDFVLIDPAGTRYYEPR